MRIYGLAALAALAVACGVLSSRLDGYFAASAGGEGILEILLGEMRSVLGDLALVRADDYFHRGIHHVACAHFEGLEHGEVESEEHAHPAPEDYIGRLNEAIHPAGHVHLSGGSLREMFPLLGAAIALDPHNEEAYLVASYWLDRVGKPTRAIEVLQQGVESNPRSYLLYTDLGKYLFNRKGDAARAIAMLERALSNWRDSAARGEEPDQLSRASILLYLGSVFEREGKTEDAVRCYQEVVRQFPGRKGLARKIQRLEGRT